MGGTALVAALPYPGKMTQISHKGQRSNKLKLSTKKTAYRSLHAMRKQQKLCAALPGSRKLPTWQAPT